MSPNALEHVAALDTAVQTENTSVVLFLPPPTSKPTNPLIHPPFAIKRPVDSFAVAAAVVFPLQTDERLVAVGITGAYYDTTEDHGTGGAWYQHDGRTEGCTQDSGG